MPKMNVNLTLTKDYRKNDCLTAQKTNPTCRGVASGEAGFKPNFHILRLALAAFFIKFLVEANPKGWRREPADKMCLSKVSVREEFL